MGRRSRGPARLVGGAPLSEPLALHSWLVREPLLNDDLPGYILTGRITIRPGVKEFKDNSVVFHNCPEEEPIDTVVFCTGYAISFPFLEESVVRVENKHASLYKYVFPTHLQKPTLAVLGLIKPFGSILPVSEMQARWVSRVFKGRGANVSPPVPQNASQTKLDTFYPSSQGDPRLKAFRADKGAFPRVRLPKLFHFR